MKAFFTCLIFAVSVLAQTLPPTTNNANPSWQVIRYYPYYTFAPASSSVSATANFTFPPASDHQYYPAFLVRTQAYSMNLSGATIRCSFGLTCSSDASFRFGGQDTWNLGPLPANARLYFSTTNTYDNNGIHDKYWFHGALWSHISNGLTEATLSFTFTNSAGWSDGQGQTNPSEFWHAAKRVKSVGLAFGGGSFYDIGIAAFTGSAQFNLFSYDILPASVSFVWQPQQDGIMQTAAAVDGPWQDVQTVTAGSNILLQTSPFEPQRYFRVQ